MPAIGRSLTYAACLWTAAAAGAADSAGIRDLLLALSTSLEDGRAARFLAQIDRQRVARYAALEQNVVALVAQNQVASSIGLADEKPDGETYELKLDWLLEMRPAGTLGRLVTRREQVRCRVARVGKRWKVVTLEPVEFFRAPER